MIILTMDDEAAKDLFAHLHEAGEHMASGSPMGPMTLRELHNITLVYETLERLIKDIDASKSKPVV